MKIWPFQKTKEKAAPHPSWEKAKESAQPKPVEKKLAAKHIIAVASGKGGVGKSTVAIQMALGLKARGARVGILDADIYGPSIPGLLGLDKKELKTASDGALVPFEVSGIEVMSMAFLMGESETPVVWRAPMVMKLLHQFLGNVKWSDLDYLILDLPPGTGDVQLTLAQQAHLDGVIIVSTPHQVASEISQKALQMFKKVQVPILGWVENMSGWTCQHCGETHSPKESLGRKISKNTDISFLGQIPMDSAFLNPLTDQWWDSLDRGLKSSLENLVAQVESEVLQHQKEQGVTPESFEVTEGGNLKLLWKDHTEAEISAYRLRTLCPCASCVDEMTGKRVLDPKSVPIDITVEAAVPLGRYALSLRFSDGHQTGIYSFERLFQWSQTSKEESFEV